MTTLPNPGPDPGTGAPRRRRGRWLALASLALVLLATPAAAQLPLPQPQLPALPGVGEVARDAVPAVERAVPLNELRKLRLRDLVRGNARVLELERGQAIVRHEVIAIAPGVAALDAARTASFTIASTEPLKGLDTSIVTLRAPEGMSTRRALKRLRELDPAGVYDFNHLYAESGPSPVLRQGHGGAASTARVGLIDSGVDGRHPALSGARVQTRSFAGPVVVPSDHGAAVASILADRAGRIYAADVYSGAVTGGSAAALARAFAWMVRERVAVVNISLVGPPNQALQAIVAGMVARGFVIVAAVGNDGPAAAPLYPASYPGVVGVTGVNARGRVIVEAARGPQVDFAAPGADIEAPTLGQGSVAVRGTSYAAPVVAGLLAQKLDAPSTEGRARAVHELAASAHDLGARGRDDVYGAGLVGRAALAGK